MSLTQDQVDALQILHAVVRGFEPEDPDTAYGVTVAEMSHRDKYGRYWHEGECHDPQAHEALTLAAAAAKTYLDSLEPEEHP